MHIIVVADHRSAPRSFTLATWQLGAVAALALGGLVGLVLGVGVLVRGLGPQAGMVARGGMPAVSDVGPTLSMMANRLGEMEAQLLRLDTFSARLSTLVGNRGNRGDRNASRLAPPPQLPQPDGDAVTAPAAGEPHAQAPTLDGLRQKLMQVAAAIEERSIRINQIESAVVDVRAMARTLPTVSPIVNGPHSSNFGARVDPFNGELRFHQGIDFPAPPGTAFTAAATGVVTSAHAVPDFGNLIEIDHGNGLVTRYAHASRIDVREGEMVLKGQTIGLVGSTGRSTGPHLHFEVREHGHALDPERFLRLDT
ncbi:MAG: M23 family metallopeptidase [Pseudomonadota bacterium]|nr:M23 family metallopeptidase [Pseudomonadota bacterium]